MSEPEVLAIVGFIGTHVEKIQTYLAFHSYSQLLMYSYGHTEERFENQDDTDYIGRVAAENLASVHGTEYEVGNSQAILCKYILYHYKSLYYKINQSTHLKREKERLN